MGISWSKIEREIYLNLKKVLTLEGGNKPLLLAGSMELNEDLFGVCIYFGKAHFKLYRLSWLLVGYSSTLGINIIKKGRILWSRVIIYI